MIGVASITRRMRGTGWSQFPYNLVAGVVLLAGMLAVAALGIVHHRAYSSDLGRARALVAKGQFVPALARYQAAINEWPFSNAAQAEMRRIHTTVLKATDHGTSSDGADTLRTDIYQAYMSTRVTAAQQVDAAAAATATAEAQAYATAVVHATQAAKATATGLAIARIAAITAHVSAIAAARATATGVAEASATVVMLNVKATRPIIYAAIGASDAVGVGATNPATENWVADLSTNLASGSEIINLGSAGALLSYGVRQELPNAVAANPDLVTVWLGVNDLNARVPLTTYSTELTTLLNTLRLHTHAAIYVGTIPDLTVLPVYRHAGKVRLAATIKAYNTVIRRVANRCKASLVDLYLDTRQMIPAHPEYVSADGFHPSSAGYAELAHVWWNIIGKRQ